jgi:cellulose biosynthesis protein BcsQ
MPIVSVLNLKGGVGKTTICANLGAALDRIGYRVLLLDLDLQGSLTSLFLSESEQRQLFDAERTLADFLFSSFEREFPDMRDYVRAILPDQKSGLVPTSDYLAYAETNLTIRWLLRDETRDPRFLLRKELQLARIMNDYDIALLDCPPLINVCCVNALAASDYLLIPVMPSKQATARAPILLQRLKEFRENINPALKVMGIIANRTHRAELTTDEQNRLTLLHAQCKDVLGEEVPQFERIIRQNVEFRAVEDECRPLRQEDEMHPVFLDLAREVESRLPTFCQPAPRPTIPAKEKEVAG